MRPKRDPVPRARDAWWWLGGTFTLGLLGAGVVAAGIALWENVDVRQLAPDLAEPPPPLPAPVVPPDASRPPASFGAVLFASAASAAYFDDADFHPAELRRWEEVVASTGGSVRVVTDAEGLRAVSERELLVVPEAPCLSPAEVAAIGSHLASGGSLVANWAIGVRDDSCEWRGWSTLLEITGAADVRELPRGDGLYLTVPGALPESPGLEAGARIELRPDPALGLRVEGERVYWSDWALNPVGIEEAAGADAAVVTVTTAEGGRVTWFSMRTGQAATDGDAVRLERLLRNGVAWAAGIPSAQAATWPDASRAAGMLVLDVEGSDAAIRARDAAAVLSGERIPVTFYVVSGLVEGDTALARSLTAAGEVGTQTLDHAVLTGRTAQDQSMRLRRSRDQMEAWTGEPPVGLHAPEDSYDVHTLASWRSVGGRYLLAVNDARSASPEIHETPGGPIVVLPRLLKDDYAVVVRDVTLRSRLLAEAFLAGAAKSRAIGGLAVIAGHTQIIVSGPRLDAFRTVADSLRSGDGWWLAEGREIADWWLARDALQVTWRPAAGGAPSGGAGASVAADSAAAADPVPEGLTPVDMPTLVVTSPDGIARLWMDIVAPLLPAGAVPLVEGVSVDHALEPWGVRVAIGTIEAGDSVTVSFALPAQDGS